MAAINAAGMKAIKKFEIVLFFLKEIRIYYYKKALKRGLINHLILSG